MDSHQKMNYIHKICSESEYECWCCTMAMFYFPFGKISARFFFFFFSSFDLLNMHNMPLESQWNMEFILKNEMNQAKSYVYAHWGGSIILYIKINKKIWRDIRFESDQCKIFFFFFFLLICWICTICHRKANKIYSLF